MLFAGINHFSGLSKLSNMARSKGVPLPTLATLVTGILLMLGGLSYIAWYHPWWGTLLLLIFFVSVTIVMHRFWKVTDPAERMSEMHTFMGNVSIIGLLLIVLSLV